MSAVYGPDYYARGCGEVPYGRDQRWLDFFGRVAERIVADLAPSTALDAGCAMGLLVEALRDRGVEAAGLDISEYAISQVRADIRPHCRTGSVLEPLPRRYDLISCVEVAEHLGPEEAEPLVANLAAHTDQVLFSSSPSDFREATHHNVRPPDYWVMLFARQGLFRDPDYDAGYLAPWAMLLRRPATGVPGVVAGYERGWWRLQAEAHELRRLSNEQRDRLREQEQALSRQDGDLEILRANLEEIQSSRAWRLAAGARGLVRSRLPEGTRRGRILTSVSGWLSRQGAQTGRR